MEKKDFELLMAKVKEGISEAVKNEIAVATDGLITSDQFAERIEALGIDGKVVKELTDAVDKQGIEIQKLFQANAPKLTLEEEVAKHADVFKSLAKGAQQRISLELKTDVTTSSITNSTIAMRLPNIGQLPTQANRLAPLFRQGNVGPNSGGVIRYIDQLAATRNADVKAEAAQKPESAITWQEYNLPVEKIADTIPVTMEAFNDIDFIATELRKLLEVNIRIKEDNQLWNGSGVTPNLKGVYTSATEYVAAASGISDANIYDLIIKMQESIMDTSAYIPNYAIMNIQDVNAMRLHKDANDNYVVPPFASRDGSVVAGITIIPSNSVTQDTMLVGDFNYGTLYRLGGITVDAGWIDKQFIENMMTLRAEIREALLVRTVEAGAFAKETGIAAALVTLAT